MSEESDWRRVRGVFEEVVGLGLAERPGALAALCGEDGALRAEVESLLRAAEEAGGFLDDDPAAGHGDPSEAMPESIGAYRLVRELGRGGMGVVYLGERRDGDFAQRAAIKVVRSGAGSDLVMRRFRAERQILAGLEHGGIARMFDGGLTPEGAPYLVMEYVEGDNLLAYCARRELGLRERVALFARVCEAVRYAHRHLVVHRDLKPSNILVGAEGEPKLLDFGLAKLVQPATQVQPGAQTVTSLRWMTPEYASPEQVRGEAATTATDVYALGVVLYELLTGRKPYQPRGSSNADLERAILEQEPARASTAVDSRGGARRALRGDLDTICAKCLQKDPQRRYGGAAELAEDLRRYLEGRPIAARPDRASYRLRKFAARHRWGLATGIATAVLLIALVASYTVRLRRERDHARRESEKQRAVATFLGGVFRAANPVLAAGRTVTARELLEEGARRAREIGGDPEVQSELLEEMAQASFRLELHEQALDLARQALSLRDGAPGARAELAANLLLVGRILNRMKRFAEAAPPIERALALEESMGPSRDLSAALDLAAANRSSLGHSEDFLALIGRAIAIEAAARPDGALLARLYNTRAIHRVTRGDEAGARADYQQSIAIYRRSNEPESWQIAMPLLNLGELSTSQRDFAVAESLLAEAAEVDARIYGADSAPSAYTLARLAYVAMARGDLRLARERIERSLAIYRAKWPADHPDVAYPQAIDGLLTLAEGRPVEGRLELRRALEIARRSGEDAEPLFAEVRRELDGAAPRR